MGTPEFAVPSLTALVDNGFNVVAVVTAPDKPVGRGNKIIGSAVKQEAVRLGLPVLQPTNLKAADFQAELKSYEADLQIVVAFRMLPVAVWDMPAIGTFNLHASLLPNYRGAAPINWAVINGEEKTGLTTFFLKHEIDTGDIILQEEEPITAEDNVGTLYARLMEKGAPLVVKTVELVLSGDYTLKSQVLTDDIKHAPKIFTETCEINFEQGSKAIVDFIRGLSPYPAAWCKLNGKKCKIYKAVAVAAEEVELLSEQLAGQNFVAGKRLFVKSADGMIEVLELQPEGKKRMEAKNFLAGNTITEIV